MQLARRIPAMALTLALGTCAAQCGGEDTASTGETGSGGTGGKSGDADPDRGAGGVGGLEDSGEDRKLDVSDSCVPLSCPNSTINNDCGDCIDNDGDGLIDAEDPHCWDYPCGLEACSVPRCPSGVQPCGFTCLPPCPGPNGICHLGCCVNEGG